MLEQIAIAVFGVLSVWCSQDRRYHIQKYACIFGLLGEPFWFWSAWKADQWGIMVLVFLYAFGWSRGFYNYWIKGRIKYG